MATEKEQQLYQDRLKKLEALRKSGIDPYPAISQRTHTVAEALALFAPHLTSPTKGGGKDKKTFPPPRGEGLREGGLVTLTGRIKALRTHGGLVFGNIEDESGAMQFMLREEDLGKKKFSLFENFDLGDIFQATGTLMKTKRGEQTLLLSDFKILAKTLRALPEKWHGLADIETKLRKRYLDLLGNPETRECFRKKAKFWKALRDFLEKEGFIEVDTPALEERTGGADATPFVTHYNALDQDFYLRISLELPLKKIIVGGFEKVYEIGKVFRNEGISAEHLQDYLMCEFYWAYADYEELMKLVENLYKYIVKQTTGSLVTNWQGYKLDWGKNWPRLDYFEIFEKEVGVKLKSLSLRDLAKFASKMGIKVEKGWGRGRIIDSIFKKKVRPKLIQPSFLINHPIEISPLAKRNPKLPGRVERVQVMVAGTEVGNGYSELNDPIDQRQRFEEQMKLREKGDPEAQMMDESFVEALEYGMPPAAGFGLSERLFSVLMDKSMRETVIFPPMREKT